MQGGLIIIVALGYLAILFAVAAYGDRKSRGGPSNLPRPNIYAFSLAVYCTSWTFFGSVGVASQAGFQFFTIYLGPILVFTLGYKLIERMIALSKSEKITSIADFLASRYGKNAWVAALAAVIAVIGTVPYIALQLKAISDSVTLMAHHYDVFDSAQQTFHVDISLIVALFLSVFAILFGTRHADATEHQDGLILAVALESLVKIAVFLMVGGAVVLFMFDGPGPIIDAIRNDERVVSAISNGSSPATWIVMTLLSASAILALPRQFHVTVVENRSESELRRAIWLFPLYLVVINLLVLPLAVAGMLHLGPEVSPDSYVLALPLSAGQDFLAFLTFTGGLSAATAMVILGCAGDHDLERPRHPAAVMAVRRSIATGFGRLDPGDPEYPARLHLHHADRRFCLLPGRSRFHAARGDRPFVVCRGGAVRSGAGDRPVLARRECAGRASRNGRRLCGVDLHPAVADAARRRARLYQQRYFRHRRVAAAVVVRP